MLGQPRLLTAGNYTLLGTRLGPAAAEPTDTRHPPNSSPSSFFRKPLLSSLGNGNIPLRCPRLVLLYDARSDAREGVFFFFEMYTLREFVKIFLDHSFVYFFSPCFPLSIQIRN